MTQTDLINRIKSDSDFFLTIILTSNPEEHANLMRGFGQVVDSSNIESLLNGFKALSTNSTYVDAMRDIAVVYENLPAGYREILEESGMLQTGAPKTRTLDLDPNDPTTTDPTNGATSTNAGTSTGKFDWSVVSALLFGFIQQNGTNKTNPIKPKKDNTIWYVLGAICVLVSVVLILKK